MAIRWACVCIVFLASSGCARHVASPARTPAAVAATRVLVLPTVLESTVEFDESALDRSVTRALRDATTLEVVRSTQVLPDDCVERVACLRDAGHLADAAFVATSTIVTLGDTAIVRMRLVPVDSQGVEQVRQSVVTPADELSLEAALAAMGRELAAPFVVLVEEREPRRRRYWRWLGPVVGVAAAGAAAGTAFAVRGRDPGPDVVIRPP